MNAKIQHWCVPCELNQVLAPTFPSLPWLRGWEQKAQKRQALSLSLPDMLMRKRANVLQGRQKDPRRKRITGFWGCGRRGAGGPVKMGLFVLVALFFPAYTHLSSDLGQSDAKHHGNMSNVLWRERLYNWGQTAKRTNRPNFTQVQRLPVAMYENLGFRTRSFVIWSAASGGLRDGGSRTSEDIWGKRPFSCVFWISQVLFGPSGKGQTRQKKGGKGRFRPISRKGGQTPLKPPFVTPPFAAATTIPFQRISTCDPPSLAEEPKPLLGSKSKKSFGGVSERSRPTSQQESRDSLRVENHLFSGSRGSNLTVFQGSARTPRRLLSFTLWAGEVLAPLPGRGDRKSPTRWLCVNGVLAIAMSLCEVESSCTNLHVLFGGHSHHDSCRLTAQDTLHR